MCGQCGAEFLTASENEDRCLSCKLIDEMKLPQDTIVNQNVLNIYHSGKFDRVHGVDPIYLKIAEGVALLNRKRTGDQLCSTVRFIGEKTNDEIEPYASMALKDSKYKKKYDAMVFIKVSSYSNFLVFGLSWSDRTYNLLKTKDARFIKNYAVSIAVKWHWRDKK